MMTASNDIKPILVIGVGNSIQRDDGVGIHAVNVLRELEWDDDVEIFDGGTAGLDLLPVLENRKTVVVIDAVHANHPPGTIYRFTPDDVDSPFLQHASLHQLGLLDIVRTGEMIGTAPDETIVIGVEPAEIDWGLELTPAIAEKMPRVIELVQEEVQAARVRLPSKQENKT